MDLLKEVKEGRKSHGRKARKEFQKRRKEGNPLLLLANFPPRHLPTHKSQKKEEKEGRKEGRKKTSFLPSKVPKGKSREGRKEGSHEKEGRKE